MYSYQNLRKSTRAETSLPSDDLLLNGQSLSEQVGGYRQLVVSGRGIVSRSIKKVEVPGRAGVWVESAQDEPQEIEITYLLEASTSTLLRERFAKLNKLLRGSDAGGKLECHFKDEPNYTYVAYLQGVGSFTEDTLKIKSTFTLFVPNPYKKKAKQSSNGSISLSDAFQVLPSKIVAAVSINATEIEISTSRSRIKFVGNYAAGKKIELEWLEDEFKATYDGRNILHELAHLSVPEEFYLRNGDNVTGTKAVISQVEWSDERL